MFHTLSTFSSVCLHSAFRIVLFIQVLAIISSQILNVQSISIFYAQLELHWSKLPMCEITIYCMHILFSLFEFTVASNKVLRAHDLRALNTYTARPVCWSGWISDSYCSLKPLCSGMGEVVPARTSPTLLPPSPRTVLSLSCSKCPSASIVVTGTVRVNVWLYIFVPLVI